MVCPVSMHQSFSALSQLLLTKTLPWLKKASAVEFDFCKPAAVRAFFLDADFDIDQNRSLALRLDSEANIFVC